MISRKLRPWLLVAHALDGLVIIAPFAVTTIALVSNDFPPVPKNLLFGMTTTSAFIVLCAFSVAGMATLGLSAFERRLPLIVWNLAAVLLVLWMLVTPGGFNLITLLYFVVL